MLRMTIVEQKWWFMTPAISHLQCSTEIPSRHFNPHSHLASGDLNMSCDGGVSQLLPEVVMPTPEMVMPTPFSHPGSFDDSHAY